MKTNRVKSSLKAGFSLVEMLVVIAIIGVIAAIAVPQISNFTDNAKKGKDQRNAQNLSSVCATAQAAGCDFTKAGNAPTGAARASKVAVLDAIVAGHTISDATSSFNNEFFGIPGLAELDIDEASVYLDFADGVLKYVPAGGQTKTTHGTN